MHIIIMTDGSCAMQPLASYPARANGEEPGRARPAHPPSHARANPQRVKIAGRMVDAEPVACSRAISDEDSSRHVSAL